MAELLPPGFDCYVRVFHPFVPWTAEPTKPVPSSDRRSWRDIADGAGVKFGPALTWRQLESALPIDVNGERPHAVWEGDLELNTADALFSVLADVGAGGYCFSFGLVAIVRTDAHLPVAFHAQTLGGCRLAIEAVNAGTTKSITTAEYVWPLDESWIVCTDYDLTSTYVALGREPAARLLAHPNLDAVEVGLNTRIDDAADEESDPSEPREQA